MCAKAFEPSKNRQRNRTQDRFLEVVKLSARWQKAFKAFLDALEKNGDSSNFSPHPTDERTIHRLAHYLGTDLYYLVVEGDEVLGYGLLRGWDEGYQVPSLGIAIHPSARGFGLGSMLMTFLHAVAGRKGAMRVRLRVRKTNDQAKRLYERFGYTFEQDHHQHEFLIGFLDLARKF